MRRSQLPLACFVVVLVLSPISAAQRPNIVLIMATCLEVAQAPYPSVYADHSVKPATGMSLLPAIEDLSSSVARTLYWEHETHAAIREGDWKLVTLKGMDDVAWELYDLSDVRTESLDVADAQPDRVRKMKSQWKRWATQANVLPWPRNRKDGKPQRSDGANGNSAK